MTKEEPKKPSFTYFDNEKCDYTLVYDRNGLNETIVGFTKNEDLAKNSCKFMNQVLSIERAQLTAENQRLKEEITQRNEYYENKIDVLNQINDSNHAENQRLKEAREKEIVDAFDYGYESGYDDAQGDGYTHENGDEYFKSLNQRKP